MSPESPSRPYAPALWRLLALFGARVGGQMLVAFGHVSFLPPMHEWYSGLLRYRYLLPAQLALIALLLKVCLDFSRGRGFFVQPRTSFARFAVPLGSLYFGSMVVRYVVRMTLHPEARWFGQTIPIVFHCVLATYVLVFGTYHRRLVAAAAPGLFRAARSTAIALVVLAASGSTACGPLVARGVLPRGGARAAEFDVTYARMTMMTSDGVPLVSEVYRPKGPAKTPAILIRVPFARHWKNDAATRVLGQYWAGRGYGVVIQGSRGRFRSGGVYYPLRHERQDGIETLAWLRSQPWFDGRLGMWGASGFAYTQWAVADQLDAEASALFIQICSSHIYDMLYAGGAFSLESALYWTLRDQGNRVSTPSGAEIDRGARGFPLLEADDRTGANMPVFNDWAGHPDRDDYWAAIDGDDRAGRLEAPTLFMAGWFDAFLPAQLEDYGRVQSRGGRAAAEARLIIGPWSHARNPEFPGGPALPPFRRESVAPALSWFDRHLLRAGPESPAPGDPPVRIYVMGENVWRDERQWPLARAQSRSWYLRGDGHANALGGDGRLELTPPSTPEPPDTFTYDPRDPVPTAGGAMIGPRAGVKLQNALERRADVLVYTSPPLTSDLEVTGPIALILHVTTTAENTDFTGKLVDVHPDGKAYNVSDGIVRQRFRPLDRAVAGEATEVHIDLWPTSTLFKTGHRLRLEVSSSNFPRFDRNPNTGRPIPTEIQPIAAVQGVFHGADQLSRLILPVIPR